MLRYIPLAYYSCLLDWLV